MPDWLAFDPRYMYRYFQNSGFKASAQAIARLAAMLGHPHARSRRSPPRPRRGSGVEANPQPYGPTVTILAIDGTPDPLMRNSM